MKPFYVIGNWKLNGSKLFVSDYFRKLANLLPASLQKTQVFLAPPVPYLAQVSALLLNSPLSLAAQSVDIHQEGAYTGEISAKMLADHEVMCTLVGHSERRQYHNEALPVLTQQCTQLCAQAISPVLCFGSGDQSLERSVEKLARFYADEITEIILPCLALLIEKKLPLLLAYEPEAYIGGSKTAPPEEVDAILGMIKKHLTDQWGVMQPGATLVMLYGGSVSPKTGQIFFEQSNIDGLLVGRSSLDPQAFSELVYLSE